MPTTILKAIAAILINAALLTLAGCPDDPPDDLPDAATAEVDAAPPPTHSLRACSTWSDCIGDRGPNGDLDTSECCSAYAGVCVKGRMSGGCTGGGPDCPYPGQPNAGVCLADTTVLPLPPAQCEVKQPADEWVPPECSTDADCRTYDDQGRVAFDGCCAVDVGRCVKGTEKDYYGFPSTCAVRTDFAAPAELCE